jgi:aminoglycoside phosphotransferase (APT) family kinase protein
LPASVTSIDIEDPLQLRPYLLAHGLASEQEQPTIQVLGGGVSNRTVYVRCSTGEYVLKQALPKLRVAVEWLSDPRRIHQEALGLSTLGDLVPGSTPQLIFEDSSQHVLAMRAVPQPHENWKTMLLREGPMADHVRQFAVLLASIHRAACERAHQLQTTFEDRSFFESLRLEPYYQYTASQVPLAQNFLNQLIDRTRATHLTLVHGDYSPKNILIHENKLILLDHEVIHWGDPAFDVGFSMTHLLSKAHHRIAHRPAFITAAKSYWHQYHQTLGDVPWAAHVEVAGVQHTLACLLARCRGRSPLEYLNESEKAHQAEVVVDMMQSPPTNMPRLIEQFAERI